MNLPEIGCTYALRPYGHLTHAFHKVIVDKVDTKLDLCYYTFLDSEYSTYMYISSFLTAYHVCYETMFKKELDGL